MYAIVDIEATGGSPKRDKVMDIAIFLYDGERVVETFSTLVNPETSIPPFISKLTGITDEMVAGAPRFGEVAEKIGELTRNAIFVAHNVQFDYAYIRAEFKRLGVKFSRRRLCTISLSKEVFPGMKVYGLDHLSDALHIPNHDRHRAEGDAKATMSLFEMLLQKGGEELVDKYTNEHLDLNGLPEHMKPQLFDELPEETGLYYFHNGRDNIIYMGRSLDIRTRVVQHVTNKDASDRRWELIRRTNSFSYKATGSELLSRLLEWHELRQLRPHYNRVRRTAPFKFGLEKQYDANGLLHLLIRPIENIKKPVAAFKKHEHALTALYRKIKRHKLCKKLCGLEVANGGCGLHKKKKCDGICSGGENVKAYNRRVHDALRTYEYPYKSFVIVGEGRKVGERSAICIEDSVLLGYAFFEGEAPKPEQIKEVLQPLTDSLETREMICKHLAENHLEEIVPF